MLHKRIQDVNGEILEQEAQLERDDDSKELLENQITGIRQNIILFRQQAEDTKSAFIEVSQKIALQKQQYIARNDELTQKIAEMSATLIQLRRADKSVQLADLKSQGYEFKSINHALTNSADELRSRLQLLYTEKAIQMQQEQQLIHEIDDLKRALQLEIARIKQ